MSVRSIFQRPFTAITQDKWQTTGLLVHFRFLVSSSPVEEGRHSCKCTNDNTDSIVQGRRLDKPEQSLMQISHDPETAPLELHAESHLFSSCCR